MGTAGSFHSRAGLLHESCEPCFILFYKQKRVRLVSIGYFLRVILGWIPVGRVEVKGRELSQGESLLITGFDSASRQPPPFEGKAWELSPLGMIRSPCLFYRARVLPALTLECSSQTP